MKNLYLIVVILGCSQTLLSQNNSLCEYGFNFDPGVFSWPVGQVKHHDTLSYYMYVDDSYHHFYRNVNSASYSVDTFLHIDDFFRVAFNEVIFLDDNKYDTLVLTYADQWLNPSKTVIVPLEQQGQFTLRSITEGKNNSILVYGYLTANNTSNPILFSINRAGDILWLFREWVPSPHLWFTNVYSFNDFIYAASITYSGITERRVYKFTSDGQFLGYSTFNSMPTTYKGYAPVANDYIIGVRQATSNNLAYIDQYTNTFHLVKEMNVHELLGFTESVFSSTLTKIYPFGQDSLAFGYSYNYVNNYLVITNRNFTDFCVAEIPNYVDRNASFHLDGLMSFVSGNYQSGFNLESINMACLDWDCKPGTMTLPINNKTLGNLSFYPNPVMDELYINLESDREFPEIRYQLHNSLGQLEKFGNLHLGSPIIPLNTLPAGIYYLNITNSNGEIITKEIIIKN